MLKAKKALEKAEKLENNTISFEKEIPPEVVFQIGPRMPYEARTEV